MPPTFASGAVLSPDGRIVPAGEPEAPPVPDSPAPEAPSPGSETASDTPAGEPPAPQQESAVAPSDDDAEGEDDVPQTRRQRRQFEARLIRENERLKQQTAALQAQQAFFMQQLQGQRPPQPQQSQTPAFQPGPQPPRAEQFATHEEWVQAQIAYGVQQALAEERRQDAQRRQQDQAEQLQRAWDEKTDVGRDKYDDYDEVVNIPRYAPTIQPIIQDALLGSDVGPDLLYYLGTHPADVRKLNSMTPLGAARFLGHLEGRLQPPTTTPNGNGHPTSPQRQTPGAPPPPVVPVGTSATPSTDMPERWNTLQEYEAWRQRTREAGRVR